MKYNTYIKGFRCKCGKDIFYSDKYYKNKENKKVTKEYKCKECDEIHTLKGYNELKIED